MSATQTVPNPRAAAAARRRARNTKAIDRQAKAIAAGKPVPKPAPTEDQIHIAVIDHLERRAKPGVAWGHFANGGSRGAAERRRFAAMGVVAGLPDLPVFAGGITRMIEIKTEKGVLSAAQIDCHAWLAAAGIEVVTCYGLDACLQQLERWGVLR